MKIAEEMESRKGEKSEDAIAKGSENAAKKITKEPCSEGDEAAIAKAAREKAEKISKSSSLTPKQAATVLHQMASSLEASKNPDPDLLVADVKKFLQAIGG